MFKRGVFLIACAAAVSLAVPAQKLPWQTGESSSNASAGVPPVRYEYPEQVELQAGHPQEVELHFRVRDGLHINSHNPVDSSFIKTQLVVLEPKGVDVEKVEFPEGQPYELKAFPGHKLSVYTGEVVLRARIVGNAKGEQMLNAALRYQACDTDTCFPPKQAPVALDVVVR